MRAPPLLPEETLVRVLRLARFDGLGVLALSGLFALVAAAGGEAALAGAGLLAAGAGAMELHGAGQLRHGDAGGLRWVIGSQPVLLLALWCYCGLRLGRFEAPPLPEELRALAAETAARLGMTVEAYLELLHRTTTLVLAAVAAGYQGGMAWYYWRRRGAVRRALAADEDAG